MQLQFVARQNAFKSLILKKTSLQIQSTNENSLENNVIFRRIFWIPLKHAKYEYLGSENS